MITMVSGAFTGAAAEEGKIDVNTASEETLTELKGVGPVLAQRIIEYREENGNFTEPSELAEVKGIGKETVEDIKDRLAFRQENN